MTPFELSLVLLSALLHAAWNAATKGSCSPTAFLLAMEGVSLLLFLPVLLFGFVPSEVPVRVWGLLAGTAVVHALYSYWLSRAYAHADLSLVYPIARSTPALVPFAAVPLLGETVTVPGAAGIALVLVGMWAVQTDGRPQLRALLSLGALFAYLTLLTTVAYSLIDKEAMRLLAAVPWSGLPPALVYMAMFQFLYLPLFVLLSTRSLRLGEITQGIRSEPRRVVAAAVAAIASYSLVLHALATAPVSYVVTVRQASVLFALALGVIFLRERPSRVRVLGAVATVLGVGIIALWA